MDCTVYGILQVRILEWVAFPFPTQGSNPGLPQCRQILDQLSHKGSLRILEWVAYPFLQQIFPTQESKRGLLHCRQILYQLSYQKSPVDKRVLMKYMWSKWMNVSSRYMVIVYTHPDIFIQICHTVEDQIFNKWSIALNINTHEDEHGHTQMYGEYVVTHFKHLFGCDWS